MKRVMAITPQDARFGFGLAGINHQTTSGADITELLRKELADPDNGLIILDERLAREQGEEILREMERKWQGIIVILPKPALLPQEGDDYALRLIRRAIGYHVRLRL